MSDTLAAPVMQTPKFIQADGDKIPYKLYKAHRSDCCGVEAVFEVWLNEDSLEPLLFCLHHYRHHELSLSSSYVIRDETSKLTQSRLTGSEN